MAGESTTVRRFEPRGFLLRSVLYAAGLYIGCTLCVSVITVAQKFTISTPKFWPYAIDWFRFWVWPVMLAELWRAPLTGLFYGLVGPFNYSTRRVVNFGATCGLLAYGFGYFFSVLASRGPEMREVVSSWNLIVASTLGLPVLLILIARLCKRSS